MSKLILGAVITTLNMGISMTAAKADCGDISIGAMSWASGETITAVATFVLEQGYGCSVQIIPTDTQPAVTSLAENGQPDIVLELWKNLAADYDNLETSGKIITASNAFTSGGEEGWWIPASLAKKYPELRTIEGVVANPELVGSRFHNCPIGWGCRIVNDNLKDLHQLEANGIEVFHYSSGASLVASIAAAFADNEPWFGYYWGPTAALGKYKMTKLHSSYVDPDQHSIKQNPYSSEDKLALSGFPSTPVLNVVTADLAKREPEVFKFLQNMSFPNDIISKMLAWKETNKATAGEAAAWVLKNYKDVILSWVNDDAKAKLSELL